MNVFVRGADPRGPHEALVLPAGSERRMNRITRMACTDAFRTLNTARITSVDGIYESTGLGCLEDTERFLTEMTTIEGGLLSPTSFMRSTHNTMAGQLALLLHAEGPNITFSQELFSFHLVLLQAILHLSASPGHIVLVAAVDERTPLLEQVLTSETEAVIGEGAASFLLSGKAGENDVARVIEIWNGTLANATTWQERFHHHNVDPMRTDVAVVGRDPFSGAAPWTPKNAGIIDIRERIAWHGSASAQLFSEGLAQIARLERKPDRYVLQIERCMDQESAILLGTC